jgi:hypothetical protein
MRFKIIFAAVALATVSACGPSVTPLPIDEQFEFEFEDCDAGDARKGQRGECSARQIADQRAKDARAKARKTGYAKKPAIKASIPTAKSTSSYSSKPSFSSSRSSSRSSGRRR